MLYYISLFSKIRWGLIYLPTQRSDVIYECSLGQNPFVQKFVKAIWGHHTFVTWVTEQINWTVFLFFRLTLLLSQLIGDLCILQSKWNWVNFSSVWHICLQKIPWQLEYSRQEISKQRISTANQVRGHSQTTLTRFWLFLPPTPLCWHFLWYKCWQKWTFLDHLPTASSKKFHSTF